MNSALTGGCQCGAVRYRIESEPTDPHLCHCRMCQKQFGNYFAALATVDADAFVVTRGALSHFQSSENVKRGFCAACGTPMTYLNMATRNLSFALPTLDHPSAIAPTVQYGSESTSPHFQHLHQLPLIPTGTDREGKSYPEWTATNLSTARQHPDHDTPQWPLTR